jgi:hypothetical protein
MHTKERVKKRKAVQSSDEELDMDDPWTASISSPPMSTSDISPFIAVLGVMESVWTRCTTYLGALKQQMQGLN